MFRLQNREMLMPQTPHMKTADAPGTLEKGIEDLRDEISKLSREAERSSAAMLDLAREHPKGTSGVLVAVGAVGFLLGFACGAAQSADRRWYR